MCERNPSLNTIQVDRSYSNGFISAENSATTAGLVFFESQESSLSNKMKTAAVT